MTEDIFLYNTEYFKSLTKDEKIAYVKNFVNDLAKKFNNHDLIKKDESPNGNIIYHIYSDGTITRQKGGWAYQKRNVTDIYNRCIIENNFFTFPYEGSVMNDTYAIIELENCCKIRKLILDIYKEM